jgi:Zn-dependent M28 family amino/carboxypeptidase
MSMMRKAVLAAIAGLMVLPGPVAAKPKPKMPVPVTAKALAPEEQAAVLRDDALRSNVAYQWVSDITTRFGARPAGSDKERAAADWAAVQLKSMGFDSAVVETFPYYPWKRGASDSIEITGPFPQKLIGVALGGSTAGTVEAEAALFDSWQQFLDSKADVTGKIVVILQPMPRATDGAGYGAMSGPIRWKGPGEAQKRGAAGFVLRSLSTDDHRFPHAGATNWSDGKGIPAMAISAPDADQLMRIEALQKKGEAGPVKLKMVSGASFPGQGTSVNVVAEIKGSEHPDEVVIIGGHLDSWDLGTGAIDDAAGHAIALAAAKNILDHHLRPKRTIRLILWGSEEMSQPEGFGSGGDNYAKMHGTEAPKIVAAMEADFGADKVWRATLPATADATFNSKMAALLGPLGITVNKDIAAEGDSDTDVLRNLGVPCLLLDQDGTHYFDIHHTPDDVLERIDPRDLDQVVAAWSATLWMIAGSDIAFTRPEPEKK